MSEASWSVNEQEYLESPAVSVLAFHNSYPQGRQGGVEIIHHGERVATCGDLHLSLVSGGRVGRSKVGERRVKAESTEVQVPVTKEEIGLSYTVKLRAEGESVRLTLDLREPLDPAVVSAAEFCLEFFPPAYFGKTFHLGGVSGVFPREPNRPLVRDAQGRGQVQPMAGGPRLVIAAEDPARQMLIEGVGCDIELIDARKGNEQAWFTVRSVVRPNAADAAVEWLITPHRVPGWQRDPVICVSQVGYHPDQFKRALIELYPGWNGAGEAALLRVDPDGGLVEVHSAPLERWGKFLRYEYGVFDFTDVREPGLYFVQYGGQSAGPFRVHADVYREGVWQPTLHSFFPVQMCHAQVWDGGRCWHGACHLDDALQAPAPHEHFDGYGQGPTTDTPYEAHQHIPHLDRGGWHDAGDTDLAAGSQAQTTHVLALAREEFGVDTDETTVRSDERLIVMHEPDGTPDIIEQIAYGVECLLGGYRAAGHSFSGIIGGIAKTYYQRGALSTMTDNLIYDPSLDPQERTGERSGKMDDRWAFTSRDTSGEYKVIAALSAAGRVLKGHEDTLAEECLETATKAWDYEQSHPPVSQHSAYVPRNPEVQEVLATAELLVSTDEKRYRDRLVELLPTVKANVRRVGWAVVRALPHVGDDGFADAVREALAEYGRLLADELAKNPFAVAWRPHIWGIGWNIPEFAVGQYYLVRACPDLFDRETVLSVLNYVLGCHPGNNVSLVSAVGVRSLTVAFGINRSDWSYIPGGMASGTALIRPDFPELKDDFPFLWQQSEYVMPGAATYIFCVLAADALLNE